MRLRIANPRRVKWLKCLTLPQLREYARRRRLKGQRVAMAEAETGNIWALLPNYNEPGVSVGVPTPDQAPRPPA